jgi:UDP-sulfoquinovose synthase
MRILILGGDGYLGWPTAMYLSARGHEVAVLDSFAKRRWEMDLGVEPLLPVISLHDRVRLWESVSGHRLHLYVGDVLDYAGLAGVFREFGPEAIVHYAEQSSAPFSMMDRRRTVETQVNNVVGTLHVLFALRDLAPDAHLIKLGTMGEYGTPNIDIEEGFLEVEHRGRRDVLPYPKQPGSFYHLSKVHDSHNALFAARTWGLRVTDLNQGIVYGFETGETALHPRLATAVHYDAVFGTVLNRFCVQAAAGIPLTVYGKGGQTRGFLHIRDTLRCVELSLLNPAAPGEFRVFNQFTEQFSVRDLAALIRRCGKAMGLHVTVRHMPNPRAEADEHYYNARCQRLLDLGLEPHRLSDELTRSMLGAAAAHRERIRTETVLPRVDWRHGGTTSA